MSTTADVNWLLGTVTQSSAALIAIIGGLLVSRYVSLHAEQDGARRRVEDLTRRLQEAEHRLTQAKVNLERYRVQHILEDSDVYETIFRKNFNASVDDVIRTADVDEDNYDTEVLKNQLGVLCTELKKAQNTLSPIVPDEIKQDSWLDFKRNKNLSVDNFSAWEWSYERISTLHSQRAKKSRTAGFPYFAGIDVGPIISPSHGMMNFQMDQARLESLRRQVNEGEGEVRALSQERRLAEETLEATKQPEGFKLALQVLTILAALGIAFPVSIMGFGPMVLPALLRISVIVTFFLGVLLLLRFLFVYSSFLGNDKRTDLPSSVFGLFRK